MKEEQNKVILRPIIYGSVSTYLGKDISSGSASHSWSLYLRGINGEDISYFIDKVEFHIHNSFENPVRVLTASPFMITESGWGEFTAKLVIYLKCKEMKRPVELYHYLKLFPDTGQNIRNRNVVSEVFDELIFINPKEETAELIEDNVPFYPKNNIFKSLDRLPEISNAEQVLLHKIAQEDEKLINRIKELKEKLALNGINV